MLCRILRTFQYECGILVYICYSFLGLLPSSYPCWLHHYHHHEYHYHQNDISNGFKWMSTTPKRKLLLLFIVYSSFQWWKWKQSSVCQIMAPVEQCIKKFSLMILTYAYCCLFLFIFKIKTIYRSNKCVTKEPQVRLCVRSAH